MWNTALIFSNKNHVFQKKPLEKNSFFAEDYVKLLNYILYTHDVTCIWVDETADVMIVSIKKDQ